MDTNSWIKTAFQMWKVMKLLFRNWR